MIFYPCTGAKLISHPGPRRHDVLCSLHKSHVDLLLSLRRCHIDHLISYSYPETMLISYLCTEAVRISYPCVEAMLIFSNLCSETILASLPCTKTVLVTNSYAKAMLMQVVGILLLFLLRSHTDVFFLRRCRNPKISYTIFTTLFKIFLLISLTFPFAKKRFPVQQIAVKCFLGLTFSREERE